MNLQDKPVGFNGVESKGLAALEFPCAMQEMLDYIVAYRGLTCEFECQPFTIQKKPLKSKTETDKTKKYYTVREMLGFIAAAHGCNAKFDSSGKLYFPPFTEVDTELTASNVLDFSIDDGEPFTVSGIYISTADNPIYIDDTPGAEYDEKQTGVIKCRLPFGTVEIAEYIWHCLGGLSYYGGGVKIRGAGILECGDVVEVGNLKFPQDTKLYPFCVTGIRYDISRQDGFVETLTSEITRSAAGGTGSGSTGSSYSAGAGIEIEKNTISLKPAKYSGAYVEPGESRLGGVMIYGASLSIDENGVLGLKYATKNSVGGVEPHDGLHVDSHRRLDVYPGKGLHIDPYGKSDKFCGNPVAVNLGSGMKFADDPEDVSTVDKNGYAYLIFIN